MEAEVVEEEAEQDKEVVASKVVAIKAARPADLGVEAGLVGATVDGAEPAHPVRMSRGTTWIRKSSTRVSRFR